MKKMTAPQQKLLKVIHLISAGLWLSCVILLTLLPFISKKIIAGGELYVYNYIYHFIDMFVLTPAAISTLLTGLIYSMFTRWGFIRDGWIVYKWAVTLAIVLTGTFYLGPMVTKLLELTDIKGIAALQDPYYTQGVFVGLRAGIINSSLLIIAVFSQFTNHGKTLNK